MHVHLRGAMAGWGRSVANLPYTNIAILLLVAGLCAFIYTAQKGLHSIEQIRLHNEARSAALQNTTLLAETLSLLKDVEVGQRGFIITGDEAFLSPYHEARKRFGETYSKLTHVLESDDRPIKYSHERLDKLVHERIEHASYTIEQRRILGELLLANTMLFVEGKRMMDEIRQEISLLQADQNAISEAHIELAREVQRRSFNLNYQICVGAALLLLLSGIFLVREKRRRDIAETQLRTTNLALEERIGERTAQLQAALQRIQTFALEQDQNIETERRRLAREVHDQLGQVFTSLKLVLLGAKKSAADFSAEKLDELAQLLDEGIHVSRRISAELRPALLDDFGLAAALQHYAQQFNKQGGPQMRVVVRDDQLLSPLQANQLFRILQEAAANVRRHAHAESIEVEGRRDGDQHYCFSIADDGIGPQPIRSDASGVRNMRERSALAGGTFRFGPGTSKGTTVVIHLTLDEEFQ